MIDCVATEPDAQSQFRILSNVPLRRAQIFFCLDTTLFEYGDIEGFRFLIERRHRVCTTPRFKSRRTKYRGTSDKHSRKLTLNQDDTVMQFLHLAEASDPRRVSSSRLKATVQAECMVGCTFRSRATCSPIRAEEANIRVGARSWRSSRES